MLRKIRITVAFISFLLVTLLFLDFTGTLHHLLGWLAKIQLVPAILSLNIGALLFIILLTVLFGRLYCSVICPLGVFQDGIARIGRRGKKLPYGWSEPRNWFRYGFLTLFVLGIAAGISIIAGVLDPYAAYGRMVNNLLLPFWQWGNNLLAYLSERVDSYAFYEVDVWIKSLPTFIIALTTAIVVIILAWRNGRTYCNTICPVGTLLGFLSRIAIFKMVVDEDKCNKCGLCARKCKASCIDSPSSSIDYSRCVVCMDCIGNCNKGAISYRLSYGLSKKPVEATEKSYVETTRETKGRRNFLSILALLGVSSLRAQIIPKATDIKMDGGLADIIDKKAPVRNTPLTPPGSLSHLNFNRHCTACQLCITACPNQVLRPSVALETFMQPEMSYERGYCRPECVRCSEVCPAGAIQPLTGADKSATQIGHAVWVKDLCIPLVDEKECGNCARHCPVEAITMIPSDAADPESVKIPAVDTERCIGCGACEHLCPSRPLSAIYVEGHERHRLV